MEHPGGLFLSAMTVCELYSGAKIKGWGERRLAELDNYISKYTVLPIDLGLAAEYGNTIALSRSRGRELTPPDGLILSTCKKYNLALLTHDSDMTVGEHMGIQVICRIQPK